MRTRRTSSTPLHCVFSRLWSASVVGLAFSASVGCADIADLQEHKPYPGFPDSLSVPCSDGEKFVECADVQGSAPQDGHTLLGRPTYRLSGNDILDELTGLSWYATPGSPQNQAAAKTYCENLGSNYRLPSRIELVSLLDFRADSPVLIDRAYFAEVKPTAYWTSTINHTANDAFWIVDFCPNCLSEFPVGRTYATNPNISVLCVRDNGEPYKQGPFEVVGPKDLFLRDARTGLVWVKTPKESTMNWKDSLSICEKAQDGSYTDLRVPNAKELATIVDEAVMGMNPAIFKGFGLSYNNTVWSSTPSAIEGQVFTLNAYGGSLQRRLAGETHFRILCVRGPD